VLSDVAVPRIPAGTSVREAAREVTGQWWMWLVAGIGWGVIALVILQFDTASVTTVGVLVGLMFALAAAQNLALTAVPGVTRWVSVLFGVLFAVSAVICSPIPPARSPGWPTRSASCSCSSAWWMVRASSSRPSTAVVGWADRRHPDDRPRVLDGRPVLRREGLPAAVMAGIWALMEGVNDITRAFALRRLHDAT
jgi:hypothetical protein